METHSPLPVFDVLADWGPERAGEDAVQTRESYKGERSAKKRNYSPGEQADKTCCRARVKSREERCRAGLLCDGQVGAKHWRLA